MFSNSMAENSRFVHNRSIIGSPAKIVCSRENRMSIPILLDQYAVPTKGTFELRIERSVEIKVTAEEARRMVKNWLIDEISYMMTATEPTLVLGERAVWRVPAILTASHIGHVGPAGCVDVDVETGQIQNADGCKKEILKGVQKLAKSVPPYTPRTDIPSVWLAKEIQPTHDPGQPAGNPLDLLPSS